MQVSFASCLSRTILHLAAEHNRSDIIQLVLGVDQTDDFVNTNDQVFATLSITFPV